MSKRHEMDFVFLIIAVSFVIIALATDMPTLLWLVIAGLFAFLALGRVAARRSSSS